MEKDLILTDSVHDDRQTLLGCRPLLPLFLLCVFLPFVYLVTVMRKRFPRFLDLFYQGPYLYRGWRRPVLVVFYF